MELTYALIALACFILLCKWVVYRNSKVIMNQKRIKPQVHVINEMRK